MNVIVNAFHNISNPFPIQFFTANNYHIQEKITAPEGFCGYSQILLVVEGTGILRCRGKSYDLKRGSAFFVKRGEPCEYEDTGGFVSAYVTAVGSGVEEIMKHFGCDGFMFYELTDIESFLKDITAMIREFHSRGRMGLISSMVYAFYVRFFEQGSTDEGAPLKKVENYIKANYSKKLTLQMLARVYTSSVAKLCRDFKKEYGSSVIEYLVNFRLDTAAGLLKIDRTLRIKDVAVLCGFEDMSYFCRMFRRRFGFSPGQVREKN